MDVTLSQWSDEIGEDYDCLRENNIMVNERMENFADMMSTMTIRDDLRKIFCKVGRERVSKQDIERFFNNVKQYLSLGINATEKWVQGQQ